MPASTLQQDTYQSGRFYFPCDGDPDRPLQVHHRAEDKFAECVKCRHRVDHFGDYLCVSENGRSCLTGKSNSFESNQP